MAGARAVTSAAICSEAGRVAVPEGLAAGGQAVPVRAVAAQHAHRDQVPQHPVEGVGVGAGRLGQGRRGPPPVRDVVGDPQGRGHPHRHRRHQVGHGPQPGVPPALARHLDPLSRFAPA